MTLSLHWLLSQWTKETLIPQLVVALQCFQQQCLSTTTADAASLTLNQRQRGFVFVIAVLMVVTLTKFWTTVKDTQPQMTFMLVFVALGDALLNHRGLFWWFHCDIISSESCKCQILLFRCFSIAHAICVGHATKKAFPGGSLCRNQQHSGAQRKNQKVFRWISLQIHICFQIRLRSQFLSTHN